MEKLWTTAEAARHLGVNEVDIEQLVREGRLTGYRLGGEFLRVRPSQVQALKGTIRFRANPRRREAIRLPWFVQVKEFLYFYDFYVVSAGLLALLVIYLVASAG